MKNKTLIFLFSGIFALALLVAAWMLLTAPQPAIAEIYQDGVLLQSIPLSSSDLPREIPIRGKDGEENIVRISSDGIQMLSSTCPDKLCVHQGLVSRANTPIVCLPHRLVIQCTHAQSPIEAVTH